LLNRSRELQQRDVILLGILIRRRQIYERQEKKVVGQALRGSTSSSCGRGDGGSGWGSGLLGLALLVPHCPSSFLLLLPRIFLFSDILIE